MYKGWTIYLGGDVSDKTTPGPVSLWANSHDKKIIYSLSKEQYYSNFTVVWPIGTAVLMILLASTITYLN